MTYYEKEYKRKLSLGQGNSALFTLVAIHLLMFVLFGFLQVIYYFMYQDGATATAIFNKNILSWFILPADMHVLLNRPWTLLTHMFIHISIWQILANMLWLWCFGFIMQELTGNRKVIPVFLYGALAGAIAFVISYNLLPGLQTKLPYASMMGASAGVMAIAISTTMISPDYRIFPMLRGGIPLWVLTSIYVIIDLATISLRQTPALFAHLMGGFAGFLFIFFLRKGYDGSEWMNNFFDWVNNLFNPDKPRKGKSIKEELFYKSTSARPYKKTPNITQQRVDDILDKINQKGYNSLSAEEKELLRRASEEKL
jgi:membrane associated rhomboid family serine protease